jgi:hypothetical protein
MAFQVRPYLNKLLLLDNVSPVFGRLAVARKDLVDWAMRTQHVLPPTDPDIFDFKLLHLDSLLWAIEHGAENGEGGHVLRAAIALVDADVECDPVLAHRVRRREPQAAREYLSLRGVGMWASRLRQAIALKKLPVVAAH